MKRLALTAMLLTGCYHTRLMVNEGTDSEPIVRSERKGVKDIRKLVSKEKVEEAWAFSEKAWFDVGDKPSEPGLAIGSITLSIDRKKLYKLFANGQDFELYHYHPHRSSNQYILVCDTLPSKNDLKSMVIEEMNFKRISPCGKIRHSICSYLGITQYNLTNKAFQDFENNPNLFISWVNDLDDEIYHNLKTLKCENLEEEIIEMFDKLEDEYIEFGFVLY